MQEQNAIKGLPISHTTEELAVAIQVVESYAGSCLGLMIVELLIVFMGLSIFKPGLLLFQIIIHSCGTILTLLFTSEVYHPVVLLYCLLFFVYEYSIDQVGYDCIEFYPCWWILELGFRLYGLVDINRQFLYIACASI